MYDPEALQVANDALDVCSTALTWLAPEGLTPEAWAEPYVLGCIGTLVQVSGMVRPNILATEQKGQILLEVLRRLHAPSEEVATEYVRLSQTENPEFWQGSEEVMRAFALMAGKLRPEQHSTAVLSAWELAGRDPSRAPTLFHWHHYDRRATAAANELMWRYLGAAGLRLGLRGAPLHVSPWG